MIDCECIPQGSVRIADLYEKTGKMLFKKKWTSYENCAENIETSNVFRIFKPISLGFRVMAKMCTIDGYHHKEFLNGTRNLMNALIIKESIDLFHSKNESFREWLQQCENLFDTDVLYKSILKIKNESTELELKKKIILETLVEFILRHHVVKCFLENAIYSRSLIPTIRYTKTGIEEVVSDQYLNSECDTRLLLNIPNPFCVIHRYKINDQSYETLEPHEGYLYFKENDVTNFLRGLKNSSQQLHKSNDFKNSMNILTRFIQHGYISEDLEVIIKVILEEQISDDWQPLANHIREKLVNNGMSSSLAQRAATIIRKRDARKGGNRKPSDYKQKRLAI